MCPVGDGNLPLLAAQQPCTINTLRRIYIYISSTNVLSVVHGCIF